MQPLGRPVSSEPLGRARVFEAVRAAHFWEAARAARPASLEPLGRPDFWSSEAGAGHVQVAGHEVDGACLGCLLENLPEALRASHVFFGRCVMHVHAEKAELPDPAPRLGPLEASDMVHAAGVVAGGLGDDTALLFFWSV